MIRRYQNSWTQKITQEKSTKFIKIFESYQVFIHKFLFQAVIYIYIYIYIYILFAKKYRNILGTKIKQEKLTKFTKILNYIKCSCISFCGKMDIPITYIAYKKNRRILVWEYWQILFWRYRNILGSKNHLRKIDEIHKDFRIIRSLHMFQNVLMPPNHLLLTRPKNIFTVSANISHPLTPTLPTLY